MAIDSCVAIAAITNEDGPTAAHAELIVQGAATGKWTLLASTLLLVEARGQGHSDTHDPTKEAKVLEHLTQPHWHYVEVDYTVALKARELAIKYKLDGNDAVHLASAIVAGADVFMTDDTKFPIDQDIEGVWVCAPYPPDNQGSLFPN